MRVLLLGTLLLAIAPTAAHAQTYDFRYPVCMKTYDSSPGGGEWIDCSFTSLPQCRASASGRAAMCEINPYFAQAQAPVSGTFRRYRRHY